MMQLLTVVNSEQQLLTLVNSVQLTESSLMGMFVIRTNLPVFNSLNDSRR